MAIDKDVLIRRLMKTFLGELAEHVQTLDRNLLSLERESDASRRLDIVRNLFRTGHTLKGSARLVSVDVLEQAGHHLESIFADIQSGALAPDARLFGLLFATADAIKDVSRRLASGEDLSSCALAALIPTLKVASDGAAFTLPSSGPTSARPTSDDGETPPPAAPASSEEAAGSPVRDAFVRIPSAQLDRLLALGGELRLARNQMAGRDADLQRLLDMARRWQAEGRSRGKSARERASAGSTARLIQGDVEGLQWLTRQLEHLAEKLVTDRRALDQVVAPLDAEIMRARMVPFVEACEGLDRAARDVARKSGKDVALVIEGGGIQIDRSIVAAIRDALLHLTRNAIDHGIEMPASRVAAGKAARGRLTLSAALRRGQVEIVIADDGRGFDIEAIRKQARQLGMAVSEDDRAAVRLAFAPGLSTSPDITEISGRGIGLDVVATAVESQRGSYDVISEPGRGSRISMMLPLTLTRLPALLAAAGGQTYAFDCAAVRGLRRIAMDEIRPVEGRDILVHDDEALPVFRLTDVLGQKGHGTAQAGDRLAVVILRGGTESGAFVVDELVSEGEIVVVDLGPRLRHVDNVTGATILPTGRIALILNAADLLRSAHRSRAGRAFADRFVESPTAAKKRLLVADDSVTTRTLVKSILEAAGYQVMDAADGMDAWQLLQENGADLVVSDVEMPRMDGIALTAAIRGSKRLQRLPVILVTALGKEEDRMRGLEAGADAYLVKSAFDQTSLIQAIEQLV